MAKIYSSKMKLTLSNYGILYNGNVYEKIENQLIDKFGYAYNKVWSDRHPIFKRKIDKSIISFGEHVKEQGTVFCSSLLPKKPFIYRAFRPPSGMP